MAEWFEIVSGTVDAFDKNSGDGVILVGTNGTRRSQRAVKTACHLGATFDYPVQIQTVVDMDMSDAEAKGVLLRLRVAAEAGNQEFATVAVGAARMAEHFDDEEYGRANELLTRAATSNAALIVLGPHEGDKPFTGTMTEKLLREGGCPVLIAVNEQPKPYKKVMVAIDFSVFSDFAIDAINRWAPEAEVHLVHAYDPLLRRFQSELSRREGMEESSDRLEKTIREQMDRLAGPPGEANRFVAHLEAGSPKEVLQKKLEDLNPDLFVIGTHSRTGVVRAVLGSVATPFIDNPHCDLIVIKAW